MQSFRLNLYQTNFLDHKVEPRGLTYSPYVSECARHNGTSTDAQHRTLTGHRSVSADCHERS
jgi:hypothetical protein